MWVRTPQPGLWFTGGSALQPKGAGQLDPLRGSVAIEFDRAARRRFHFAKFTQFPMTPACMMGRSIHFARRAGEILWSLRCAVRRRS